ncbi:MAG: YHS domain-containing protein [Planctomycetota bacterium]|jgi:YHS domain-containing protein
MNHSISRLTLGLLRPLKSVIPTLGFLSSIAFASPSLDREGAKLEHLNLSKSGLAIDGYDPVAYFPEGGSRAIEGKKSLVVTIREVTYRFSSEKNREAFLADPERFEPDFGGWCAWAMTNKEKVEIDPESYLIQADRLLLFFDGFFADTRKSWQAEDEEQLNSRATANWNQIVGQPNAVTQKRNSKKPEIGLEGMDPVDLNGSGQRVAGLASITTKIGGVEYHFSTQANRLKFVAKPEAFLKAKSGTQSK